MDPVAIILVLLGALQLITFGLFAWVLLTTVKQGNDSAGQQTLIAALARDIDSIGMKVSNHGEEIASLKAFSKDINRRFDETNAKIDELKGMLGEFVKHRRATDHN